MFEGHLQADGATSTRMSSRRTSTCSHELQARRPEFPRHKTLLGLQRSAGNEAVSRLVEGLYSVQRDAVISAGDGTTAELEAELQRLQKERLIAQQADSGAGGKTSVAYEKPIRRLEWLLRERQDTGLADCGVSLNFDGRTLSLFAPSSRSWSAVSGRPLADGTFDYSKERQRLEGTGPIPSGTYWLDPTEMADLWWHFTLRAAWGKHRITLHPFGSTSTFGRGGFFIHGGDVPGSAGCIDLTSSMDDFAQLLAQSVSSRCRVQLTVSYPEPAGVEPAEGTATV
jgi:hypothetical protein